MDPNLLNVSVVWHHFTEAANFKTQAQSISSENTVGPFDILPGHANLISILKYSITIRKPDGKNEVYYFARGMVEVSGNQVRIFLEGKFD